MSQFPPPNWWCAAPTCKDRAEWRVEISSTTFITCCTKHKEIYKRMLPGVIKILSSHFRVPKKWKPMYHGNRIYGATRVAPPWEER